MAIWMQMSLVDYSDVEETSDGSCQAGQIARRSQEDPGSLRRVGLVKVATFSPCVSNFLNFWTVEGAPRLESGVCRHTPLE